MFRWENAQALVGLALVLAVTGLLSEDRRRFPWKMAIGAIAAQLVLVMVLFGLPSARAVAQGMSAGVDALTQATAQGTQFVFGFLAGGDQPYVVQNPGGMFIFAFNVLPLILVISALSALLWHWKVLKIAIRGFGFVFQKTMGLGGASALSAATNIFLGNVECALVVKGYLDKLSRAELFLMMVLGLSTAAGSTMVAYILVIRDAVPAAAAHVITAAIVSAPAGILLARIMVPEKPGEGGVVADYDSVLKYESSVDAISVGIQDGLNLVLNIGATLIVAVALVALVNILLGLFPEFAGEPLTVQRILGGLFAPLAWSLGAPARESGLAGYLLGAKLALTEVYAFIELGRMEGLSERSRIIMTYALCGFANVGSVGILVSGFGVLMPERRSEIIGLIGKALLAGFLATCMSAAVVGALPRELFGLGPEGPPPAPAIAGAAVR
jgi:concentrative nucleoside transporter, CNT family